MSDKKLSPKQETFCQEYIKDLNATKAGVRAGYSEKTANEQASRLLAKVNVAARVQELMNGRAKRNELTADKVLNDIEEVRLRCSQGVEVLDKFGQPTGVWKFDSNAALKASELQGKHLKLFTDKVEHSFEKGLAEKLANARKRMKK